MSKFKSSAIPIYYLFGEAPKDVAHDFLHLERIAERTVPAGGRIRPHRHGDLNHFFVITRGSGLVFGDIENLEFSGASVLFIPAGIVHGFRWSADIEGFVLTVASSHLNAMFSHRDGLEHPGSTVQIWSIPDRQNLNGLRLWLLRLERELRWQAPIHRYAVEANLLGTLTEINRVKLRQVAAASVPPGAQEHLVAQFREQIEKRFKTADGLEAYLEALRVSETQLRYACQKLGEKTPMQFLLDRRLLEAKRLLLYTNATINECAAEVGFDDPGYFSRQFSKRTGQSPKAFRQQRRKTSGTEAASLSVLDG